jgi:hypothetical protein
MLLHNRYFLYFVFFVAFLDFLYLGYIEDLESVSIFILVGILTAFFNKNMIVVLSSTLIITNVLKYSRIEKTISEGLTNEADDETAEETSDNNSDEPDEPVLKEEFGQDEKVVYTSVEDQTLGNETKMILAHEQLLEKMNKYKPLLDTLSGLTKNMATMKQLSNDVKTISDDNTQEYKKETADIKSKTTKSPKKSNRLKTADSDATE